MYRTSMYQVIVFGLGFLLLFGAGYLIKNTDRAGVLTSGIKKTSDPIATTTEETGGSALVSEFEGTYLCDVDSGCQNPSLLTMNSEGEARMDTSYSDGVEVLQESGTWKKEKNGELTILLTGTDSSIYPIPRTLSIRYASPVSLSGIDFDASSYKDWARPVFRRQQREQEQ